MKISLGIIVAVLCIVGSAWAGQFGPPEPMADPGKFSLGVGYWFDQSEMKPDHDYVGVGTLAQKSNQLYLQGDYTFIKDWEAYGRLGGATLKFDNNRADFHDGEGEMYGTFGMKGVVYRYKNLAIGPFVEASLYGDHEDRDVKVKDQWDLNFGVSSQYKIPVGTCDFTVYAGPFVYWNRAKVDVSWAGSENIEERHNIGGFLGVKFPILNKKLFFTAEGQVRDKVGAGASIGYVF